MQNRDGHPNYDVVPDMPKGSIPSKMPENKFLGFDPITKEQQWLHDRMRGGISNVDSMTGI